MLQPEISIVIPFYQVEQYIRQCLQSVVDAEMFTECEVLMISDGSTDEGPQMAAEFSTMYSNMKLYSFENGGLSLARNRGLALAQGKYVFFLDSDDLITKDYLKKLYDTAESTKAEIVYAGFSEVDEKGENPRRIIRTVLNNSEIRSGCMFLEERMNQRDWKNQVWCALYRRDFLTARDISFPAEVRTYEDVIFSCSTAIQAEQICTIPEYGYLYRIREQSLVHGGIGERDLKACFQVLSLMLQKYDDLHGAEQHAFGRAVVEQMSMTAYHIGMSDVKRKKDYYRKLKNKHLTQRVRTCGQNRKEKLKLWIFRWAPELYYHLLSRR